MTKYSYTLIHISIIYTYEYYNYKRQNSLDESHTMFNFSVTRILAIEGGGMVGACVTLGEPHLRGGGVAGRNNNLKKIKHHHMT